MSNVSYNYEGQVALVTGAASGMGLAAARATGVLDRHLATVQGK